MVDIFRGCVYNREGFYEEAFFQQKDLAAFLANHLQAPKIIVTDIFDVALLEMSGGFVLHCRNQRLLAEEILPQLIPVQRGEAEPPEFVPLVLEEQD